MATTFTVTKTTPHSIVYTVAGDGNPGTRTGNTLIGDLASGPLKSAIAAKVAANLGADFNLDGAASGLVRTRIVTGVAATDTVPSSIDFRWTATGLSATLTNAATARLEIRLQHSSDR